MLSSQLLHHQATEEEHTKTQEDVYWEQQSSHPCDIFKVSMRKCAIISATASAVMAYYFQPIVLMHENASLSDGDRGSRISDIIISSVLTIGGAGTLLFVYYMFLQRFMTMTFTENGVQRYDMEKRIKKSTVCTCGTLFVATFVAMGVWVGLFIYRMYDIAAHDPSKLVDFTTNELSQLSSVDSPIYWANGLLMSPVFILFVSLILICILFRKQRGQMQRISKQYSVNAPLVEENVGNDVDQWSKDRKMLIRMIMVHSLLLFAWIMWKYLTTPFIKENYDTDDMKYHAVPVRDNGWFSFWTLSIFTFIIKTIIFKIVNIEKEENALIDIERYKVILEIIMAILFSFGLKFVFTNIEEWDEFLVIAALKMFYSVFMKGSFLSHRYGHRMINKAKELISGIYVFEVRDLEDTHAIIEYNKEMAFGICLDFIISASSSVIMMAYFGMNILAFDAIIDVRVFEFLATDFCIECLTHFGQIWTFKKRDRKYINLGPTFVERTSWISDEKSIESKRKFREKLRAKMIKKNKKVVSEEQFEEELQNIKPARFGWFEFLIYCLCLAFVWIGSMTGMPADFKV